MKLWNFIRCALLFLFASRFEPAVQAQLSPLQLRIADTNLVVQYSLGLTNGCFFILNSDSADSLLSSGSNFFSGYSTVPTTAAITNPLSNLGPKGFFILLQYPGTTPDDLVQTAPIDDGDDGDASDSYFFDASSLPSVLPTNQPIALQISLNDSQGNLQIVNGNLLLSLVDTNGQTPAFFYSITLPTLNIVNGIASNSVVIQSAAALDGYVLAATFTASTSPSPMAFNSRAKNVSPNVLSAAARTRLTQPNWVPLANYADNSGTFRYPLATNYPVIGGFGEWPGHTSIHWGMDFAAGVTTPVYAAQKGIVTRIGTLKGAHQIIVLDHGNGYATAYLHIHPEVTNFQIVNAGDEIATVAPANETKFPVHLHFEIMRTNSTGKPVYPYQRDVRYPYPKINPINLTNPLIFDRGLALANDNHVAVKGVLITKQHPALFSIPLVPAGSRTLQEQGITNAYFLIQVGDFEGQGAHPITPLSVVFSPDGKPSLTIDFQNDMSKITNYLPTTNNPGYAFLTSAEKNGLAKYRYKYWFNWDTSLYSNSLTGPRTVKLASTDVTGYSLATSYSYGPKLSVTQLGAGLYKCTLQAFLGTNGDLFQQPDSYNLTLAGGATFDANGSSQLTTEIFTSHLSSNTYNFTLNSGIDPKNVTITAKSSLLPCIGDKAGLISPFPGRIISSISDFLQINSPTSIFAPKNQYVTNTPNVSEDNRTNVPGLISLADSASTIAYATNGLGSLTINLNASSSLIRASNNSTYVQIQSTPAFDDQIVVTQPSLIHLKGNIASSFTDGTDLSGCNYKVIFYSGGYYGQPLVYLFRLDGAVKVGSSSADIDTIISVAAGTYDTSINGQILYNKNGNTYSTNFQGSFNCTLTVSIAPQ